MNKEEFIKEITKLNIEVTEDKLNKLEIYYNELIEYNKHTNLTRIVDKEEAYLKHFFDSLTITKVIDLNSYENLLDIGSGAGLPGVVIKIFYPNIKVTLLDSNNKKTKFLEHIKNKLKIDLTIINDRTENYVKETVNNFDVVVARAVANLRVLIEISTPFVKKNGYFIAMKAHLKDELEESEPTINIIDLTIEDQINFELTNDAGVRNILKIRKNRNTNLKNLRTYDKIVKIPLKYSKK